ncbi:MAG: histidine--tRNA ligase, partial [Dysgonamonadaceae bacterium]|nr:histidine--tRNA ligase [Dysgonamonadaceae bacterium]
YLLPLLSELRKSGIPAEIYPEAAKIKKQLSYANDHQIPFAVIAGETEMQSGTVSVKNMVTGEQQAMRIGELGALFWGK